MSTRQPTPCPEPGIYPDIPDDVYHSWDAAGSTTLKNMLVAPAVARHHLDTPDETTPSLAFGRAVHRCVLEPERFGREYCRRPDDLDRRTSAGKDRWGSLVAKFGEENILSGDDCDRLQGIMTAVRAHPSAAKLLYSRAVKHRELSVVWHDMQHGVACKARFDAVTAPSLLIDLKTTRSSADPDRFGRVVEQFRYHVQATHYMRGAVESGVQASPGFVFVAVETTAPYLVSCVQLGQRSLDAGQTLWTRAMRDYASCRKTGFWPGYSGAIETCDIPAWAAEATADIEEELAAAEGGAA